MIFPSLHCCACVNIPAGPFDVYGQMAFVEEKSPIPPDPALFWRVVPAVQPRVGPQPEYANQQTQFLVRSMSRGHVNLDSTWAAWWIDFSAATVRDLAVHSLITCCPDYDGNRDIVWIIRTGNRDRPPEGVEVEHHIDTNPANWTRGTWTQYVAGTHAFQSTTKNRAVQATIPITDGPLVTNQAYELRLLVEAREETEMRVKFVNFRDTLDASLEFQFLLSPDPQWTDPLSSTGIVGVGLNYEIDWLRRPDGKILLTMQITPFADAARLADARIELTFSLSSAKVGNGTIVHDAQFIKYNTGGWEAVCIDASTKSILGRFDFPTDDIIVDTPHSPAAGATYWPPTDATFQVKFQPSIFGNYYPQIAQVAAPSGGGPRLSCGKNGILYSGAQFTFGAGLTTTVALLLFSFDRTGTLTTIAGLQPPGSNSLYGGASAGFVIHAADTSDTPYLLAFLFPRRSAPQVFAISTTTNRTIPTINDSGTIDPFAQALLGSSLVTLTHTFRIHFGSLTTKSISTESRNYYGGFGSVSGAMGSVVQRTGQMTVLDMTGDAPVVELSSSAEMPNTESAFSVGHPGAFPGLLNVSMFLADSDGNDTIIYMSHVVRTWGSNTTFTRNINGSDVTFYNSATYTGATTKWQVRINGTVVWEKAITGDNTSDIGLITSVRAFRGPGGDAMFAFVERRYSVDPNVNGVGGTRGSSKQRLYVYKGTSLEWTMDETTYATAEPTPFAYTQQIEASSKHIYLNQFAICDDRIYAKGNPGAQTQISRDNVISLDGTRTWPVSRFGPWVARDLNLIAGNPGDEEQWDRTIQHDVIYHGLQFTDAPSTDFYPAAVCSFPAPSPAESFDELDRWYQGKRDGDDVTIEPHFW